MQARLCLAVLSQLRSRGWKAAAWTTSSSLAVSGPTAGSARRHPLVAAAFASVLALALFVLLAASAHAAPYVYDQAAGEELTNTLPGGAFTEPLAINFDSAGNLYIGDARGNGGSTGVIDKFDEENTFLAQIGASTFTEPFLRGVAVDDETGHVYAGESSGGGLNGAVDAFDEGGALLSQWAGVNPEGTFGESFVRVAVDNSGSSSNGDVYASTGQHGGEVLVFEPQNGDTEEGKFLRRLVSPEGFQFGGQEGIAVDQATGQVYVANQGHKVVDVFSPTGAYETQITGPSPIEPFAEPIAVAVDPLDGHVFVLDHRSGHGAESEPETVYEFGPAGEFLNRITQTAAGQPFVSPAGLAVQAAGPLSGALYVVDAGAKKVDVFAEQEPAAPSIEAEGVQQLGESSATFVGEVNPRGAATGYRFEYGPCATPTSCALSPFTASAPVPDAALGFEDFTTHPVAPQHVAGLLAATTYHFRLIAHNADGEVLGKERVFTTPGAGGASVLPDGRQWELVSPPQKSGQVTSAGETGLVQAAADGSAIAYPANATTEPFPMGFTGLLEVLSARGPGGWTTRDLGLPARAAAGEKAGTAPPYRFFSDELQSAVAQPFGLFEPAISSQASEQTPYLQRLGSCSGDCFAPLVTGKPGIANVPPGTGFGEEALCEEDNGIHTTTDPECGPLLEAASADGSHFVLRSAAPLETRTPPVPRNELYEWSGGKLSLVSVLPPNGAGEELPVRSGPELSEQPLLGFQYGLRFGSARNAVSSDGSRVFFEGVNEEGRQGLYMRDTVREESVQIDAAETGCPVGACESGGAHFQFASIDGSRVFFTDTRRLTADSGARETGLPETDLYECRFKIAADGTLSCALTDLTPAEGAQGADVQGDLLGAAENGSAVYYVADGTLSGLAPQRGDCINLGEAHSQPAGATCSLYVYRPGIGTRLVTTLSGADVKSWGLELAHQPTRVSPDGRWLSFLSQQPLTGYDNTDAASGRPDAELFLYDDSGSGHLSCVSCDPSGARPVGVEYEKLESGQSELLPALRAEWEGEGWVAALPPRWFSIGGNKPFRQSDYLSNSGRLFFNALDALVPSDTNGTGDVYQYEPPGVGSCTTASSTYHQSSGGCVDLISSGTSPEASAFLDASEIGDDVFFLTGSRLSPLDVDNQQDVYDAHVCTAEVPCIPEPTPPAPPCSGEACQAAATPPAEVAPSSQTFAGPGNPLTCRKNQVKKGGKCVKKHPKKSKKKKQHKKSTKGSTKGHADPKRGTGR